MCDSFDRGEQGTGRLRMTAPWLPVVFSQPNGQGGRV